MKASKAGELLELSLGFEKNAQELYNNWAKKFAGTPDVATFWREYSADEAGHYRLLEGLRARLSPDQLATLIESDLVGDTRRLLIYLQKEHHIEDLDQAYQYANMIEHSEVNPLFEVIMSTFETDQEAITLLRSQLEEHINKLIYKFPKRFSRPELRQTIKVQP
jgi:rubrerythrin